MMVLGALFLCLTCLSNLEERQEKVKDKQIEEWTELSHCSTETLLENTLYNARLMEILDENHMRIMIKHKTHLETYTMRLLNCEIVDKNGALAVLNKQKEDLLGLCSVYIHYHDDEAKVWYITFCDRFKQSLSSKLYKTGAAVCNYTLFSKNPLHIETESPVPPAMTVSDSDSIDSLPDLREKTITESVEKSEVPEMCVKEEITIMFPIQRQDTLPVIIDNGIPIVERRCGSEKVEEMFSYHKSVTMPYIVDDEETEEIEEKEEVEKEIGEFSYQKQVTMPYIVE